jgi:molecular chaperone GrpE (heat shock protein)
VVTKTVRKVGGRQQRRKKPPARIAQAPAERVTEAVTPPPPGDGLLDGAIDSLRRVLGDLLETRVEAVARDLAELRRAAAAGAERERLLEQLDALLARLGAIRFSAETLDVVDPLIHVVIEERRAPGVPRGVIVEAVRPGFRSGRGLVLCKAAVAVSGG